jgi:FkbM family methyltransferase
VTFQRIRGKLSRDGIQGLARAVLARLLARRVTDENAVVACLLLATNSGTMIDVGACHGSALLPFARKRWRVLAFEPDPLNRHVLLESVATLPNVTVRSEAIAETDGETLQFYASPESPGVSSLTPFLDSHKPIARVSTTRLDTCLTDAGISAVDYLKIDAEGHDLFVLRTYPFHTLPPRAVLCEFEDRKTLPLGYDMKDMANFLVDAGYEVVVSEWYPIERYGKSHKWRRFARFPTELVDPNSWGNLVAFRKGDEILKKALQKFGMS